MAVYVLEMSTDADIHATELASEWPTVTTRFRWADVKVGGWNLSAGATIIVIAHCNKHMIGNASPGSIDISPTSFLGLVQGCMARGAMPEAVYVSACARNLAGFAVCLHSVAQTDASWLPTRILGNGRAVAGPVPAPTAHDWYEIW